MLFLLLVELTDIEHELKIGQLKKNVQKARI